MYVQYCKVDFACIVIGFGSGERRLDTYYNAYCELRGIRVNMLEMTGLCVPALGPLHVENVAKNWEHTFHSCLPYTSYFK